MDHQLYGILSDIREDIASIKGTLIVNTAELERHIKRTELLEAEVHRLDRDITKVRGFFTIAGWLVGICATIITIAHFWLKVI